MVVVGIVDIMVKSKLTISDIIMNAIVEVQKSGYVPELVIIGPEDLGELLQETKFLPLGSYPYSSPVATGEIGKIFGVKVLIDPRLKAGKIKVNDKIIEEKEEVREWNPSQRC